MCDKWILCLPKDFEWLIISSFIDRISDEVLGVLKGGGS